RPDVPEGVAAVVAKMMEKDPNKRFQTPADVVAALAAFTKEPVPPPREEEMPRLSPAALVAAGGSATPGREGRLPAAKRVAPTGAMPKGAPAAVAQAHGSSNRLVALGNTPAAPSEKATPPMVAAHVPTKAEGPRRKPAATSPSQLLEQAAAPR